jgi:MFS transporter, PPP family, 3-phenylpropionic acid transporter
MNRIRFFYLLTQGALGIYLPFINVYLEQEVGLSGRQIGALAAISPVMTLLAGPIWGAAADTWGSRLQVLRLAIGGAATAILLLAVPESLLLLVPAMILFTVFQVAIIPLSDSLIAAAAARQEVHYGELRLWGSIGFALSGLIYGQVGSWLGLRSLFPGYALLMALALPVAWQMVKQEPAPPPPEMDQPLALLKNQTLALFLVVAGLAAIGISGGYLFLYVFLRTLGASAGLIGMVSAVGALAEVPFMIWGGRLIKRWGARPIFAVGMGFIALGWGLYAILKTPLLAPFIHLSIGAGMGLLWPAAVTYVARETPAGRDATAQSLLNATMYGVAPLIAVQLAGAVFDTAGPRAVLGVSAGALAAGVFLSLLTRHCSD